MYTRHCKGAILPGMLTGPEVDEAEAKIELFFRQVLRVVTFSRKNEIFGWFSTRLQNVWLKTGFNMRTSSVNTAKTTSYAFGRRLVTASVSTHWIENAILSEVLILKSTSTALEKVRGHEATTVTRPRRRPVFWAGTRIWAVAPVSNILDYLLNRYSSRVIHFAMPS